MILQILSFRSCVKVLSVKFFIPMLPSTSTSAQSTSVHIADDFTLDVVLVGISWCVTFFGFIE